MTSVSKSASRAVAFIVAREEFNAGERDYAKALAAQINLQGQNDDTSYFFYKIQPEGSLPSNTAPAIDGSPQIWPLTDAQYAAVPLYNVNSALDELEKMESVKIIGVGHSTLDTTLDLAKHLGPKTETSYITHMIDDHHHLQKIVENNVHLFATTKDKLSGISPFLAQGVHFTKLDAVPHTNSLASCDIEYQSFLKNSPNGKEVGRIVDSGEPFAFVVVNAGFEVGPDKKYTPYTEQEAWKHGYALGQSMSAGTYLIAVHGGPRNLRDETPSLEKKDSHTGQKTLDALVKGYREAQNELGANPGIIIERFVSGLHYNAIKAGYILGRSKGCVAFISNSEGYGTMDGAVLHVNNQKVLLGMFPFESQYLDPTGQRQENIEKYNKSGISELSISEPLSPGKPMSIKQSSEQKITPYQSPDAAETIVNELGLAKDVGCYFMPNHPANFTAPCFDNTRHEPN